MGAWGLMGSGTGGLRSQGAEEQRSYWAGGVNLVPGPWVWTLGELRSRGAGVLRHILFRHPPQSP